MARLQRKKITGAKKKKTKNTAAAVASGEQNPAVAKKVPLFPGSGTESIKRRLPTQKKALKTSKTEKNAIQKYIGQGIQFLREVKVELKKVTWPSKKQAMGSTVVVIILVLLISVFLGVVDMVLSYIVRIVLHS
jgi:preprotein translocase subunit SecE